MQPGPGEEFVKTAIEGCILPVLKLVNRSDQ